MTELEKRFESIRDLLIESSGDIASGPMMSAPGIKYKNKVFTFFNNDEMVFRLGKGYDIEALGITEYSFLNPFMEKPPMKGWFCISAELSDRWEELARIACDVMKKEIG